MARIDYETAGPGYDTARGLELEGLGGWHKAVTPYLARAGRVLDVGAGTGQFALAFASWFPIQVVAIEPAAAMRTRGAAKTAGLAVAYLAASDAPLPVSDGCAGAAWLSTVIHHLPDLRATAAELRRALSPGAPVLIRGAFPGRTEGISLFHYFPEAARVVETFPTIDQTVDAFATAGFAFESLAPVPQTTVPSLLSYRARLKQRKSDTTLSALTDDEFAAGVHRIDDAIAAGAAGPVIDYLDLLVLR